MNIQENISLKKFNTFGIDATARYFSGFNSVSELPELLASSSFNIQHSSFNIFVLGGGSNILFTKNVNGLVLKNEIMGIEKIKEADDFVYIKAGAGENWHRFVLYCLEHNYAGVENLALIPGNVGASPMQNIGAYGVEIKDVFHSLEAFSIEEKRSVVFNKVDCAFGYRESIFKNKYAGKFIITSVTYKLSKKPVFNTSYGAIDLELKKMNVPALSITAIAQAVMNIRRSKLPDPAVIGNAGSFFKNPEVEKEVFDLLKEKFPGIVGYPTVPGKIKLAAGWLIEQAGWKGYRAGDAGCHEKQALVLVNYGNASGEKILELSAEIIQSVYEKFNVSLEKEVNVV